MLQKPWAINGYVTAKGRQRCQSWGFWEGIFHKNVLSAYLIVYLDEVVPHFRGTQFILGIDVNAISSFWRSKIAQCRYALGNLATMQYVGERYCPKRC